MYVEKDYIMRLIHEVIRTLFRLLCNVDIDRREEQLPAEVEEAFLPWKAMIDEGRINEAENLLTEGLDGSRRQEFLSALLFYEYLSRKDEGFLLANGYSREEIAQGLKYVVNFYGYGGMVEAFLEDLD